MAQIDVIRGLCAGIPDATMKRILIDCFEEVVGKTGITMGDPDHQRRATNLQSYFQVSTTATSTGEFSIRHGMERAPTLGIAVIDLGQPGAQLVPLEVTRAADSQRIFLKSTSTGARVTLLVE